MLLGGRRRCYPRWIAPTRSPSRASARGRIAATQPDGAARLVIADYAGNILDTLDYGAGELMDCGFDGQDNLWTPTMASSRAPGRSVG